MDTKLLFASVVLFAAYSTCSAFGWGSGSSSSSARGGNSVPSGPSTQGGNYAPGLPSAHGGNYAPGLPSAHGGNPAPFIPPGRSRDLLVEVIGGKVRRMDTFTSDPYMSISVCEQKKKTDVKKRTLHPVWNFKHVFTNVRDDCRLKWHLYDEESFERDDTIGIVETTVGQFIKDRKESSTLTFGKKGDSNIEVKVKYV